MDNSHKFRLLQHKNTLTTTSFKKKNNSSGGMQIINNSKMTKTIKCSTEFETKTHLTRYGGILNLLSFLFKPNVPYLINLLSSSVN